MIVQSLFPVMTAPLHQAGRTAPQLIAAQQDSADGTPIGIILIGAAVVIIFAVIWFLYEEGRMKPAAAPEQPQPETVLAATEAPAPTAAPETVTPDDLTRIEGIGPRISGLLQAAGIATFAQLAATEVSRLQQLLTEANIRLADPQSWPEQAALAAAGEWEKLDALQEELKGGRRV